MSFCWPEPDNSKILKVYFYHAQNTVGYVRKYALTIFELQGPGIGHNGHY